MVAWGARSQIIFLTFVNVTTTAYSSHTLRITMHRGLKLYGAIGQGKICNSLKSEKFSKSFLSHIGKNKIKFKKK